MFQLVSLIKMKNMFFKNSTVCWSPRDNRCHSFMRELNRWSSPEAERAHSVLNTVTPNLIYIFAK